VLEKVKMIRGDSSDYDLLIKWAKELPKENKKYILSCEIGVKEGLGSKIILDNLQPNKHIGIDPYGNLKYQHYDHTGSYTCDYTEKMRTQLLKDMSDYENFTLFHMRDIDYMNCFATMPDVYDFVHFDGPHMTKDVIREAVWFADRSSVGTRFVFDDHSKYNMDKIADILTFWNFKTIEIGNNKICLEKKNP
jgi:hypothetical protein